jgi:alcohol dehydrogenase class IV
MHGHGGQLLSALSSSRLGIFQPMGPDIATSAQAMASIIADTIIAVGGGSF